MSSAGTYVSPPRVQFGPPESTFTTSLSEVAQRDLGELELLAIVPTRPPSRAPVWTSVVAHFKRPTWNTEYALGSAGTPAAATYAWPTYTLGL